MKSNSQIQKTRSELRVIRRNTESYWVDNRYLYNWTAVPTRELLTAVALLDGARRCLRDLRAHRRDVVQVREEVKRRYPRDTVTVNSMISMSIEVGEGVRHFKRLVAWLEAFIILDDLGYAPCNWKRNEYKCLRKDRRWRNHFLTTLVKMAVPASGPPFRTRPWAEERSYGAFIKMDTHSYEGLYRMLNACIRAWDGDVRSPGDEPPMSIVEYYRLDSELNKFISYLDLSG